MYPLSFYKEVIETKFPALNQKEFIESLHKSVRIMKVKKDELIMDYGDYIRFVPLLIDGLIKVVRQSEEEEERLLYFLTGGESCAASFSCCMLKKRSEIKVIAQEDSTFFAIPLFEANKWMSEFAVWRNFIFTTYDQKLIQLIDTIDQLTFYKLDEQLIRYLEHKAQVYNSRIVQTTHQEIAQDLNVSREAVSRLLKALEKDGQLKLERNRIVLED